MADTLLVYFFPVVGVDFLLFLRIISIFCSNRILKGTIQHYSSGTVLLTLIGIQVSRCVCTGDSVLGLFDIVQRGNELASLLVAAGVTTSLISLTS